MPAATKHNVIELLGPSTGGIRAHVGELARRLDDRGWLVRVVGPAQVMDGAGVQSGTVNVPASWNPVTMWQARRSLRRVAGLGPADLIHAHGLKAAAVALAARTPGRRDRPPVVLTVHNLVAGTRGGVGAHALVVVELEILRRADHVVVISDEMDDRVARVVPADRRSFILPVSPQRHVRRSRAEVRTELGVARDAAMVAVVARHHPQKDLPMFLRAFAIVVAALPRARAVLVGDGPQRAALEALVVELGVDHAVVFAGHRPNPVDEMNAADVVALTSRWEGSPLVVSECLSLGRPLVTTAVGTVTRLLTDGVSARVVPVGDHAACARALLDVIADPAAASAMAEAGRRVALSTFDPDRLVDAVEAAYREVIRRSASPFA